MSAVLEAEPVHSGARSQAHLQTIRVGLLGLGHVGQAVARLAPEASRLKEAGFRFRIGAALVRAIDKPRRCLKPERMTTNPSAFLRGNYDVVVETLGSIEPARSIVSRVLGRGIPVVTANKALVASHGRELAELAARRRTTFRYEASALAGVPFLGAFNARPLVSDIRQFAAVVNGTSNFILSTLERGQHTFAEVLEEAQALGFTEPDPARDLDGLDALDKLTLLASIFGWGALPSHRVEVEGIRRVTARDAIIAQRLNSVIRPVVFASRNPHGEVSAFVGPALVAASHPLASLRGALSGILLKGAFVSELFFSGPGAGPEITAATILDDVVEAVTTSSTLTARTSVPRVAPLAPSPATGWLVRAAFPGVVPDASTVMQLFATHNLNAIHVTDAIDDTRWIRVSAIGREQLSNALSRISTTHRLQTFAFRIL